LLELGVAEGEAEIEELRDRYAPGLFKKGAEPAGCCPQVSALARDAEQSRQLRYSKSFYLCHGRYAIQTSVTPCATIAPRGD
jgi:hypothetical protein